MLHIIKQTLKIRKLKLQTADMRISKVSFSESACRSSFRTYFTLYDNFLAFQIELS